MIVNLLQKYEPKDWTGLTTENHLGTLFGLEPILISPLIEDIYRVNYGEDFLSFLDKFPTEYIDDDRPYEWLLQGADERNIALVSAEDSAANLAGSALFPQPGLGFTRFFMRFSEKYFVATDVIVGNKPDLYKLRVVSDPVADGTEYLYEVELLTGDPVLFVAPSDLAANTRWSKDYSQVEQTLSRRGGDVSHTSPFRMQNVLSMIRKQYVVPGNMILKGKNSPVAFAWKVDGKVQTTWLNKLDFDFNSQFRREIVRLLFYGTSNRKSDGTYANKGDSGYEIRSGAGLREQIAPANLFYYNSFNLDWLTEIAMGLSVGKLPEDQRRFVLGTGEYGMFQFHQAAEDKSSNYTPNFSNDRIQVDKRTGKMSYIGQFLEYKTVNGITFELMHVKEYDNPVRNKLQHPSGGLAESRRYTIMDFGTANGESNVSKIALKGQGEILRYIPGLRDPFTPGGQKQAAIAASAVDGYEVHKAYIGGLRVKNPMRMAEIVPSILV
ncbi:MAG: hypothetical protein UV51_C0015G0007 [Candidatus Woesebacteria bacterium GW2011_GWC1_42_9]|nr:MAG: hypothetical protein UV51_C0015G0007 [Candidatus Woesebacteria bacterium GW2011_GWC1_42_9]